MSSSFSKYLSIARTVTFSTTLLFSLIVMSISADLISLTEPLFYYKFAAFALATALLSLLTVSIMFAVDFLRQGSIFSYVVVEISWLSILWVLWLSSGSYAAWTDGQLTSAFPGESACNFGIFADTGAEQTCHEIKAIMAFSFLIWILLMSYTVLLLVLAIRAQERGNSVWNTGVRDGVLFLPGSVGKTTGGAVQVQAVPATIPYSPQSTYTPQQLPPQQLSPQHLPPQQSQQPYPPYPSPYPIAQV